MQKNSEDTYDSTLPEKSEFTEKTSGDCEIIKAPLMLCSKIILTVKVKVWYNCSKVMIGIVSGGGYVRECEAVKSGA